MGREENRKRFEEWQKKLSAYQMALTLIGLDANQHPLSDGADYRNERTAILSSEYMKLQHEEGIEDLLTSLFNDEEEDDDIRRMAELHLEQLQKNKDVPSEEYADYRRILMESERQWLICKANADYESYYPYLERLVSAYSNIKKYANKGEELYDQLLNDNQEGYNSERYDQLFDEVRKGIVPLLNEIKNAKEIDDSFLHGYFPAQKQREFTRYLMNYIGFDPSWGTVEESEHPLTTGVSHDDMRFTTNYRENDPAFAILSSMHESGHAYSGHQTDKRYEGTSIAHHVYAGMGESQSRLVENHIGRTKAFWEVNLPALKAIFPDQLKGVSVDDFYRAVNKVQPSLVRTEADEVTYPLHIMVRYEIEKGIFRGQYQIKDLDEVWNAMYKEYLGVDVPDAGKGILQDMHWPYAYFGYFPTYLLGSAFAAQFAEQMENDIDVDHLLRTDRYKWIMGYLGDRIHRYFGIMSTDEIIENATGKPFDPGCYVRYLRNKYSDIYGL